jgi:hypothetical protein
MCGAVRYELSEPPVVAGYCHCTRCRRRTGSASVSARIVPGTLRLLQGADLVRAYEPPDGGWAKAFCATCGSGLWSESPDDAGLKAVRMGTFDEDPGVRPSYRQFVAYAAPWEAIPDDGLPRFPERRPS